MIKSYFLALLPLDPRRELTCYRGCHMTSLVKERHRKINTMFNHSNHCPENCSKCKNLYITLSLQKFKLHLYLPGGFDSFSTSIFSPSFPESVGFGSILRRPGDCTLLHMKVVPTVTAEGEDECTLPDKSLASTSLLFEELDVTLLPVRSFTITWSSAVAINEVSKIGAGFETCSEDWSLQIVSSDIINSTSAVLNSIFM